MTTRVLTTNPAGHTVSKFENDPTIEEIAEIYREFYDTVNIIHIDYTIPKLDYLECFGPKNYKDIAPEPHLYSVKKDLQTS